MATINGTPAKSIDELETYHGAIPVDTGQILLVDPAHIPAALLRKLTTPNKYGVTAAVLVQTPVGDGTYRVFGEPGALVVDDPYFDPDGDPLDGNPWGSVEPASN